MKKFKRVKKKVSELKKLSQFLFKFDKQKFNSIDELKKYISQKHFNTLIKYVGVLDYVVNKRGWNEYTDNVYFELRYYVYKHTTGLNTFHIGNNTKKLYESVKCDNLKDLSNYLMLCNLNEVELINPNESVNVTFICNNRNKVLTSLRQKSIEQTYKANDKRINNDYDNHCKMFSKVSEHYHTGFSSFKVKQYLGSKKKQDNNPINLLLKKEKNCIELICINNTIKINDRIKIIRSELNMSQRHAKKWLNDNQEKIRELINQNIS